MKILLLSCSTGQGHNSAALAVQEELQSQGIETVFRDPVTFKSERAAKISSGAYNGLIRKTPRLFGVVYRMGSLYSKSGLPSPVYYANATYAKTLADYIKEEQFDAVICSHLYGMEALTAAKRKHGLTVPTYGILTDYTCIPFTFDTALDGYFVPHEDQKKEMLRHTELEEDQIFVTGIPVSPRFAHPRAKEAARDELGIDRDKTVFLLMTGGVGCENLCSICDRMLYDEKYRDFVCYVFVGKNDQLKAQLDERYAHKPQIKAIAFTDKIPTYLCAGDVLLTKAGGLSSTEAGIANIPMVHIKPIPGCETKNARFFAKYGMSMYAKTKSEAVVFAHKLASCPDLAQVMRRAQKEHLVQNSAKEIVRIVTERMNKE